MSTKRPSLHFLRVPAGLLAVAVMLVATPVGSGRQAHAQDNFVVEDTGPVTAVQTSRIESLTPAQARQLVADFKPDVALQVEVRPDHRVTYPRCLILNGLTSLDATTAAALAEGWKGGIMLGGLTSLDVDAAEALATHDRTPLSVFGLKTLDAGTARVLAKTKGWDGILSQVTTLEADVAAALAAFNGRELYLDGLTEISPEVAEALGKCKAVELHLDGLTTLSPAAAAGLSRFGREGSALHLTGLTTLDAESAKSLAASKGWTGSLPKLERLDAATAAVLVDFMGSKKFAVLSLGGLRHLDGETARALVTLKNAFLDVSGLQSLSVESATALAGCDVWIGVLPQILRGASNS